ncbi:hypothetical protein FRC04_006635 [Tulasnella sp. 424]|nr:hypothetical protein FRC04_006635 [Tulasnella sp. 424]
MQPSHQAEDKLRHHSALYIRMCLSGTYWEFEVREADINRLKDSSVIQGAPVVDFQLASIFNRYTEFFPGSPEVLLLPEITFSSWKREPATRPNTGVRDSNHISNTRHVVFPFHWEKEGRWLLVVLADFSSLLPPPEPAVPAERKQSFAILVFDALKARVKPPYHTLTQSFQDFAKALLTPKLDINFKAITEAKIIAPMAPLLSAGDCQAAQPGHYLGLFLAGPSNFIDKCKSTSMVDADWDLPGRAEVVNQFKVFLITHSSLALSNITWSRKIWDPAPAPAVAAGGGVAPDEEWQWKQPTEEAISNRSSPELDLTQPAEPDHLISELLHTFLSEDLSGISLQSIDDEVVRSILEEVMEPTAGPADVGSLDPEEPASSETAQIPQHLRSEYLNQMYLHDFLPLNSVCAGRTCRALASLHLENNDVPAAMQPPSKSEYCCCDCVGGYSFCEECIVSIHDTMPFHRVERWNGLFFEPQAPTTPQIHQLMYLGHNGSRCDAGYAAAHWKRPVTSTLTVLHVNGYHKLQVQYCNCIGSPEPYLQLLRAGLFPATHARPSTAFTFQLLKHFQRFNLASKTAAYDYHKALLHLTDNVLPQSIPSAYHQFVDAIRQWRVLIMLRRAGKQKSTDLQDGELAVACPACPRPGINLPPGWEDNPQRRLLYGKFISGDGNFHLVHRRNNAGTGKDAIAALQRRSSMIGDAAFWVPRAHFDSYLAASKGAAEQRPPAQCNTVAGNPLKANTSATGKNEVTGAFAISCRHVCFCANGVCDFSRGEGYRYVDVPMAMVINASINAGLKDLVISYDIACKYSINFLERVCNSPYPLLPDNLQSLVSILWLIGKFHLGGHCEECQKFFNFNYTQGVGRMSGELVEIIWSYFDFLKYQTREMGPGSRQEMLSDAMNYWNWQKIVKMS